MTRYLTIAYLLVQATTTPITKINGSQYNASSGTKLSLTQAVSLIRSNQFKSNVSVLDMEMTDKIDGHIFNVPLIICYDDNPDVRPCSR